MTRLTLSHLQKLYQAGEKITMLTCYDASFAALMDVAAVEILLVGDSLGMVVQGHESTLPVSMRDAEYHTACVARGSKAGFILGDMPFGSYQEGPQQAFRNAARLMSAGANMVKLEGGRVMAETVAFLTSRGIPVCGHIGLTPQSVNQLGGFRVQGKTDAGAKQVMDDALALQDAGASAVVLETIPATLGKAVTEALSIPTIGIGAGVDCSGQILVLYDVLDIYPGRKARFVRNFMQGANGVSGALADYVKAVKERQYPGPEHCF